MDEGTMIRFERWRPLIEATRTEEALIAVMREYCDTLLPSDMDKLPDGCPACAVHAVSDIGDLAVDFRALDLKFLGSENNHATLHDKHLLQIVDRARDGFVVMRRFDETGLMRE